MEDNKLNEQLAIIEAELKKKVSHGHESFVHMTLDELTLHDKKNFDYAGFGDPLGNFHRVGKILELYPNLKLSDPSIVAIVYALKQLDAALWLKNTNREGQVEVDGKNVFFKCYRYFSHEFRFIYIDNVNVEL